MEMSVILRRIDSSIEKQNETEWGMHKTSGATLNV